MFFSGLFITMRYSVSYLAFAITAKLDRKPPIVMNRSRDLHSSQICTILSVFHLDLLLEDVDACSLHEFNHRFDK